MLGDRSFIEIEGQDYIPWVGDRGQGRKCCNRIRELPSLKARIADCQPHDFWEASILSEKQNYNWLYHDLSLSLCSWVGTSLIWLESGPTPFLLCFSEPTTLHPPAMLCPSTAPDLGYGQFSTVHYLTWEPTKQNWIGIQTCWLVDQWNQIEDPGINPHKYQLLIFFFWLKIKNAEIHTE